MFNSFCFLLNTLHLSYVSALLRLIGFVFLYPFREESEYKEPTAGWRGWIDVPLFGVVAFRSYPAHRLHFRW